MCRHSNYGSRRRHRRPGPSGSRASHPAVVRDAGKDAAWVERGCELAIADMNDAAALSASSVKGKVELEVVLRSVVENAA
ncbi:MAG: hypothetical protein LAO30_13540 [Acidobacteriia bacterium]|nr:hypothetical protein [Terriglobia bacterium]